MGRDRRSRSRSPGYKRRRSRSRSPGREEADAQAAAASFAAQMQQQTLAAQQQQMMLQQQAQVQQQMLAQQLIMAGLPGLTPPPAVLGLGQVVAAPHSGAAGLPAGTTQEQATIDRKQREVYIGNLAIGIITRELLKEFFDQVFAHLVPDPVAHPPVVNVNMDTTGRFAFVEFVSREMATKALEFDKVVELCGRAMNIGRPKGYIEPAPNQPQLYHLPWATGQQQGAAGADGAAAGQAAQAAGGAAAPPVANVGGVATTVVLLYGLLPAGELRKEEDRQVLRDEVQEEAAQHGVVAGVVVPAPPAAVQDPMPGRCYIKYASPDDAAKGRLVFDTRTLDDHAIRASFVSEEEYSQAEAGLWVAKHTGVAGIPLPGLYTAAPIVCGITGLSALNPSLASLVASNPGITNMLAASINEDEVPFEEGWVKLRGFPASVTKADIVGFVKSASPDVSAGDISLVLSADGTSLGEAFVHVHGPRAKLRLALARDRAVMPSVMCPVEVLTAVGEDLQRRILSGCQLV